MTMRTDNSALAGRLRVAGTQHVRLLRKTVAGGQMREQGEVVEVSAKEARELLAMANTAESADAPEVLPNPLTEKPKRGRPKSRDAG